MLGAPTPHPHTIQMWGGGTNIYVSLILLPMQLVNIGSQYSYSSDDQSEFLVVVSREFDEQSRLYNKPTDKEKVCVWSVCVW